MKKIILLTFLTVAVLSGRSQGNDCIHSKQLCLEGSTTYPASTNAGTAGDSIGCLITTPNPAWFAFQVQQPGRINIVLTANSDLDFACWGPFSGDSITDFHSSSACSDLFTDTLSVSHDYNAGINPSDLGGYPIGNLVDCSYSPGAAEYIHIPGALTNEWYIILVTNYSNAAIIITLKNDTSSTGSSNCAFCAQVADIYSPQILMFPNPASDKLNCIFENIKNRRLTVVDVAGKMIASWESNLKNEFIDINAYANGIYFLKVKEENQTYFQKFIIHKD